MAFYETPVQPIKQTIYKTFWDGFSARPDMDTMMLNTSADELEVFDRHNILGSLPDYTGMDVADIGAGIGRFTSSFAERARHVIASDFIKSFIETNSKRNAHFNNITYKVSDSTTLQLTPRSLDLVFTNWLLMYLNDNDTISFLMNTLKWLRSGGYLHIRESCSEPSTGRAKTASMHESSNPTRYRFSSTYLELFNSVHFVDENGEEWRLNIEWAQSVPTYIEHQSNWRQVHWLARKTLVNNFLAMEFSNRFFSILRQNDSDVLTANNNLQQIKNSNEKNCKTLEKLFNKMNQDWIIEQLNWDAKMDGDRFAWTDAAFKNILNSQMIAKGSTIFCYNPRRLNFYTYVNAHVLSDHFACNVWSVETNPYLYRVSLTKANELKDQRVRFAWNQNLESALDLWKNRRNNLATNFNGFIATELFAEIHDSSDFKSISNILSQDAFIVTLEAVKDNNDDAVNQFIQKIKMLEEHFKLQSIIEVTEMAEESMQSYLQFKNDKSFMKPSGYRWILLCASL